MHKGHPLYGRHKCYNTTVLLQTTRRNTQGQTQADRHKDKTKEGRKEGRTKKERKHTQHTQRTKETKQHTQESNKKTKPQQTRAEFSRLSITAVPVELGQLSVQIHQLSMQTCLCLTTRRAYGTHPPKRVCARKTSHPSVVKLKEHRPHHRW